MKGFEDVESQFAGILFGRYLYGLDDLGVQFERTGNGPGERHVTLDGTPVEGAGVVFTPEAGGLPANATTDASGKFTLKALLGPHTVAVTKTKAIGGSSEELAEGESPEDMGEGGDVEYLFQ
jgi:hypothetical protein